MDWQVVGVSSGARSYQTTCSVVKPFSTSPHQGMIIKEENSGCRNRSNKKLPQLKSVLHAPLLHSPLAGRGSHLWFLEEPSAERSVHVDMTMLKSLSVGPLSGSKRFPLVWRFVPEGFYHFPRLLIKERLAKRESQCTGIINWDK